MVDIVYWNSQASLHLSVLYGIYGLLAFELVGKSINDVHALFKEGALGASNLCERFGV